MGEEKRPLCVSKLSAFEARGGEDKKKEMPGESIGIKSCCRCEIVYDTR